MLTFTIAAFILALFTIFILGFGLGLVLILTYDKDKGALPFLRKDDKK